MVSRTPAAQNNVNCPSLPVVNTTALICWAQEVCACVIWGTRSKRSQAADRPAVIKNGIYYNQSCKSLLTKAGFKINRINGVFQNKILDCVYFALLLAGKRQPSSTVSWCFEPSQPQWITSGWTQTSPSLLGIHFSSHHTTSHVFWAYLYSAGSQHGNLPPAGWPILSCGPTQKPCVSHSHHRRNRERFWKKNQI